MPLRSIVIGKFESARSVLSASGLAVYTEIRLHVTDVFEDASGHISPGGDVTLAFLGGTVQRSDGRIISFLTGPKRYFLQPARTYLLVLRYYTTPDMYTVANDWDFTSGTVRANTSFEREREIHGGSEILGLTKDGLTDYFNKLLKK